MSLDREGMKNAMNMPELVMSMKVVRFTDDNGEQQFMYAKITVVIAII